MEVSPYSENYAGLVNDRRLAPAVAGFLAELAAIVDEPDLKVDDDQLENLGRRAGRQITAALRWAAIVGEHLDTTQVTQLLGVSRQALAKRQQSGSLLGLPGEGTTRYPTWQFDQERGEVLPVVREIIGAFRDRLDHVDPLIVAAWATTPQVEDLPDGQTPAGWLRAHRDSALVRQAAERAAARLAQ